MYHGSEVAKHNSRESCWVVVHGKVFDVTEYLDDHPGGAQIMLQYGGKDATWAFEPVHPAGIIERTLPKDKQLGPVDPMSISGSKKPKSESSEDKPDDTPKTPLSHCMSLDDIERAAIERIPRNALIYFRSAADSLGSLNNNASDWKKVTFRPRILRNVKRVNMTRTMFGLPSSLPIFVAPAARAQLVHEDGELLISRAAARQGIVHCPSTYSTIPHDQLATAFAENIPQPTAKSPFGGLIFQLYVNQKKARTLELIKMAQDLGFRALVITVDSPVIGKREEDERYRAELLEANLDTSQAAPWTSLPSEDDADAPPLRGHHSSTLDWEELKSLRQAWGSTGPVALKGIQCAEDAKFAAQAGVDAIYLSNHGGRQCDDAPSSIRTLLEIRKFCPEVLDKCEVYLDGGVRRGADVVKAIALGARGVGLGRPFMFACALGIEGVEWTIKTMSEEIETTMRLIGITSLDQLSPKYVNTKMLEMELPDSLDESEDRFWDKLKAKL